MCRDSLYKIIALALSFIFSDNNAASLPNSLYIAVMFVSTAETPSPQTDLKPLPDLEKLFAPLVALDMNSLKRFCVSPVSAPNASIVACCASNISRA